MAQVPAVPLHPIVPAHLQVFELAPHDEAEQVPLSAGHLAREQFPRQGESNVSDDFCTPIAFRSTRGKLLNSSY